MMKRKGVYGCTNYRSSPTPADISVELVKDDGAGKLADPVCYQSMVGSLLYVANCYQDLTLKFEKMADKQYYLILRC